MCVLMKFFIFVVGYKMLGWIVFGFDEYMKWMLFELCIELCEIKFELCLGGCSVESVMVVEW